MVQVTAETPVVLIKFGRASRRLKSISSSHLDEKIMSAVDLMSLNKQ
jgi:hypothetical protein